MRADSLYAGTITDSVSRQLVMDAGDYGTAMRSDLLSVAADMTSRRAAVQGLAVFALAFANAMFFHDKGIVLNEEGQILAEAEAVHSGKLLYRDVDCFVAPGVWYVTAGIFELFGTSVNATRIAMAVLFAAATWLVFRSALTLATPGWALFAVGAMQLQKVLAFPAWNFVFYTEFAVCSALVMLWGLLAFERSGRIVALAGAGAALGACALFKQNLGVVLGAGAFVWLLAYHRRPRELAAFVVPAGVCVLAMVAAFAAQGALPELWHGLVVEPLTGFGEHASFPPLPVQRLGAFSGLDQIIYLPALFGEIAFAGYAPRDTGLLLTAAQAIALLVYALPLLLAGVLVWRALRRRRLLAQEGLLLAVGVAGSSLAYPRPDFLHTCQGLALWTPALAYLLATSPRPRFARASAYALAAGVALFCLALVAQLPYTSVLELPRARLWLPPAQRDGIQDVIDWMRANAPPDEPIAVVPHGAMYYFLLERPVPYRFSVTLPPQIGGDRGRAAAAALAEANVGTLIWMRHGYPGLADFEVYGAELASDLKRRFEIVFEQAAPFGLGDQLWILRRRPGAPAQPRGAEPRRNANRSSM